MTSHHRSGHGHHFQGYQNGLGNFYPSVDHHLHNNHLEIIPRHATQLTLISAAWDSEDSEELARFGDASNKISRIAPDFVKSPLFPQNLDQWSDLGLSCTDDELVIKHDEKKALGSRTEVELSAPAQGCTVKSIFGPQGKQMEFEGSSVLGLPTIWSDYQPAEAPQSVWPSLAELRTHGDNRAEIGLSYRTFPLPRAQDMTGTRSFEQLQFIYPLPMDEIRPEFTSGPTYAEYKQRNAEYDHDESIMYEMEMLLGEKLHKSICDAAETWSARVVAIPNTNIMPPYIYPGHTDQPSSMTPDMQGPIPGQKGVNQWNGNDGTGYGTGYGYDLHGCWHYGQVLQGGRNTGQVSLVYGYPMGNGYYAYPQPDGTWVCKPAFA
ncbi:hypothetical protein DV735_g557, partial [Chaetothyriales sp. CBS 134920]